MPPRSCVFFGVAWAPCHIFIQKIIHGRDARASQNMGGTPMPRRAPLPHRTELVLESLRLVRRGTGVPPVGLSCHGRPALVQCDLCIKVWRPAHVLCGITRTVYSRVASAAKACVLACILPLLANTQPETATQQLQADNIEVRLSVHPTRTTTAGVITAELEVAAPTSFIVEIAGSTSQRSGQLNVVSETSSRPVTLRPGIMGYRHRVVYRPFLAGTYEVPAFTIAYRSGEAAASLVTTPVPLTIQSVIEGDPARAQPSGLLSVDTGVTPRVWTTLRRGAGALVLLAIAGWFLYRRRPRQTPAPVRVPDPFRQALAAIESLPAHDLHGLERAIESLRARQPDPLPRLLGEMYQWIRFGSPTAQDIERFRASLQDHLRHGNWPGAAKERR